MRCMAVARMTLEKCKSLWTLKGGLLKEECFLKEAYLLKERRLVKGGLLKEAC